jgi:hypothetical protein
MNKNNYFENESLGLFSELKLFNKMKNIYFKRTPESDSLYRRRNRLIILASSCLFYYNTNKLVFKRFEMKVLLKGGFLNKIVFFV